MKNVILLAIVALLVGCKPECVHQYGTIVAYAPMDERGSSVLIVCSNCSAEIRTKANAQIYKRADEIAGYYQTAYSNAFTGLIQRMETNESVVIIRDSELTCDELGSIFTNNRAIITGCTITMRQEARGPATNGWVAKTWVEGFKEPKQQ